MAWVEVIKVWQRSRKVMVIRVVSPASEDFHKRPLVHLTPRLPTIPLLVDCLVPFFQGHPKRTTSHLIHWLTITTPTLTFLLTNHHVLGYFDLVRLT